jgi:hypothetical protein
MDVASERTQNGHRALLFPDATPGSETASASAYMTSRIFAATTRKTSRRSRLEVIFAVRFRSSSSRSF